MNQQTTALCILLDKIESYRFECEGGSLRNCVDWHKLRESIQAPPEPLFNYAEFLTPAERQVNRLNFLLAEKNYERAMETAAGARDNLTKIIDYCAGMVGDRPKS